MLAWMAGNHVAANLLMFILVVGGLIMAPRIRQEVFPEFTLDIVSVSVVYPGASPAEVEQGVVLAIEEAVRGVDNVKEVTSVASEGVASVTVELLLGTDRNTAAADIQAAVDRITSFPEEIERPTVRLVSNRRQNVSLVLYGDVTEGELRAVANRVRDELLADERITYAELSGVRPLEISVEVPEAQLRQHGLTLQRVADAISAASIDLPAGGLENRGREVLVRTTERRDVGAEFDEIVVLADGDGGVVRLGDIADVTDGFRATDQSALFEGQRAALVNVFRVGDETPIEVTDAVREYIESGAVNLPQNISMVMVNDSSQMYRDRISLLLKNAFMGLALVLLVLGIFLEMRLAFWVTLGIPISFLGAMLFMPALDASLNMISLFAFILTLGIVVDDAIVVGEAVYNHRQAGLKGLDAAVAGVREVAAPVTFSVLTTMMAFVPMLFVPGGIGKIMKVIPMIVIAVFAMSLIESLFVLPAHLARARSGFNGGLLGLVYRAQQAFGRFFERIVDRAYRPAIDEVIQVRYLAIAVGIASLALVVGLRLGGVVKFTFLPAIEDDEVFVTVEMPFGTDAGQTEDVVRRLQARADEILARLAPDGSASLGTLATIGEATSSGGPGGDASTSGSHIGQLAVYLVPLGERSFTTGEFVRQWREAVGEVPSADRISFQYDIGPGGGAAIEVALSHRDIDVLEAAANELAAELSEFSGVEDIDDGIELGKPQLDLTLTPAARSMGLTEAGLARQLRASLFGAEAVRQQRGRDELRVYVRRPESERSSEFDVADMLVFTPGGGVMTLRDAAEVERGVSYTRIVREDGRRVLTVSADVDDTVVTADEIAAALRETVLPELRRTYPGLTSSFEGQQREQVEALGSLGQGMLMALVAMYALMAVAFRSYVQPFIVMFAIPFGVVGAVMGHVFLGYALSMMSMFGIVALAGVVVNDSLVLVTAVNDFREQGMSPHDAVVEGAVRRVRPILLTSLTTFFGLMPMLLETSTQARFLIPMAISLGFGVLLTTFVTLVMVPSLYLIVEDVVNARRATLRWMGLGDSEHEGRGDSAGAPAE